MNDRELSRLLAPIAAGAGARLVTIETTGAGHKRIIYERRGVQLKQVVSATLSDRWYGRQKMAADARRLLRGENKFAGRGIMRNSPVTY
jgi:hypothetical protein